MIRQNHTAILARLPIWGGHTLHIKKLVGGRTNVNYLVQDGKRRYVARFAPSTNATLGLVRGREIYNTRIAAAAGLGPNVVRHYPRYRLLLVEYLEGRVLSSAAARKHTRVKKLAKLLRKLHAQPSFRGTFDPFVTIHSYLRCAKKHHVWFPHDLEILFGKLRAVKRGLQPMRSTDPCHLDLATENIIEWKGQIKLLDWEYSANMDYRFDLAMLSVCGKFSRAEDLLLMRSYGKRNLTVSNLQMMKAVVCLREATWGLAQLAISSNQVNYRQYAEKHFAIFRKLML